MNTNCILVWERSKNELEQASISQRPPYASLPHPSSSGWLRLDPLARLAPHGRLPKAAGVVVVTAVHILEAAAIAEQVRKLRSNKVVHNSVFSYQIELRYALLN
jgi:hypothetical protein